VATDRDQSHIECGLLSEAQRQQENSTEERVTFTLLKLPYKVYMCIIHIFPCKCL